MNYIFVVSFLSVYPATSHALSAFTSTGIGNLPITECIDISKDALNGAALAMNCVSGIDGPNEKTECSGDRVLHTYQNKGACEKFRGTLVKEDRKYWLSEDPYNQMVAARTK